MNLYFPALRLRSIRNQLICLCLGSVLPFPSKMDADEQEVTAGRIGGVNSARFEAVFKRSTRANPSGPNVSLERDSRGFARTCCARRKKSPDRVEFRNPTFDESLVDPPVAVVSALSREGAENACQVDGVGVAEDVVTKDEIRNLNVDRRSRVPESVRYVLLY